MTLCIRKALVLVAGVLSIGFLAAPSVQAIENTIVYLECKVGDQTSRGTGVIVSARGDVLTAKHVVPDGATCMGSIGVADSNNAARMVIRPTNAPVDAALLQFSQNRDYAFAGYCRLDEGMIRKKILIAGYPGRTQTGAASYREGILSTVLANGQGILETDAQSVAGMSGGPVYSQHLKGIVGIVIGAQFTPQGTPEYYGILPVETVAALFGLQESAEPCFAPRPSTEELLARIEDLEVRLSKSNQMLSEQLAQKAKRLENQLVESKVELMEITEAHAKTLLFHNTSLEDMKDHPDRLKSAEGTLSEVEANIEWDASIVESTGSIRVNYKKIVSSGGGINEIGLIVTPFYTTKRTDGNEGFVNEEGPTLLSFDPEFDTLASEPTHSKLGGSFEVNSAIRLGFIEGKYNLNKSTYQRDHPLTALNLTVIPVQDGALGEKVSLRLRIPQDQWKRIYDNYLENAQNGV